MDKDRLSVLLIWGKLGEHPIAVLHALLLGLESHGVVMIVCYCLFVSGIACVIQEENDRKREREPF